ncbi:MAG: hypothetical protein J6J42_14060 [Lachnospiraceae bacterium]|nr:hypothetical protein [Lachnospiraceae bacterium]MBP3611445.1 hypothetical protein [Lachnospiraceae bacterium]
MKVAFWSSAGRPDSAAYSMAAVGSLLSMVYQCEVVLGSNYISNIMLQDCFSGKISEKGVSGQPFRYYYGTLDYYRELWEQKEKRQGNIVEIPMPGVTILYPPDAADKEMFYYQTDSQTMYLLDTAGEHYTTSETALEEADLIVAFLPQEETAIQNFFEQYTRYLPKTMLVIENYHKKNRISLRSIDLRYGTKRWKNAIIPYDNEFIRACENGRLEMFLRDNRNCSTQNSHFYFMSNLLQLTERLYDCKRRKDKGGAG